MSTQDQKTSEVVDVQGEMTRTQETFLRAFAERAGGPDAQAWPTPGIMRRWMRKRSFRRAMEAMREAQRMQAEMHLTASSVSAARAMQDLVSEAVSDPTVLDAQGKHVATLTHILRLTHVWQRFATQHALRKAQIDAKCQGQRAWNYDPYRDVDPAVLAELDRAQSMSAKRSE